MLKTTLKNILFFIFIFKKFIQRIHVRQPSVSFMSKACRNHCHFICEQVSHGLLCSHQISTRACHQYLHLILRVWRSSLDFQVDSWLRVKVDKILINNKLPFFLLIYYFGWLFAWCLWFVLFSRHKPLSTISHCTPVCVPLLQSSFANSSTSC